MKISKKNLQNIHVKQLGQFACGLACLSAVSKYHGRDIPQEKIREVSGTTLEGTTLLGLYQAAQALQFIAKGFEGTIDQLKSLNHPVILHVLMDGNREHFVVFYGMQDSNFILGDPSWGIMDYTEDEISAIWKSKHLLSLKPSKDFKTDNSNRIQMMGWLRSLIEEDIAILSVAAVIGVIMATLSLSTAIFSQKLVDDFLPSRQHDKILIGFVVFAILLTARAFLGFLRGLIMARQGKNLSLRILRSFIGRLLRLPIPFVKGYSSGDLIARLNDSMRIRSTVAMITGDLLISIMVVLISCGYIFFVSMTIGLVSLTSVILFSLLCLRFSPKILKSQKELMNAHSASESQYIDAISGLSVIKSYNKEENFEYRVNTMYEIFQNKGYSLELLSARFGLIINLLAGLYVTVLFGMGVWQVLFTNLSLGELMALVTVGGSMVPSLANLVMANIHIQGAWVAFQRMYEISSVDTEQNSTGTTTEGFKPQETNDGLRVSNLGFRFPGRRLIINDLSLHLRKGESIALFGQIGSGKSTYVDLLQRFYKPEAGNITLDGVNSEMWPLPVWRTKLGVVRQDEKIFNSTILDNICLSNDPNEINQSIKYLNEIDFGKFFNDFPQGYATLCGENGSYLSGGQKQLVTLARALNKHPEFLILDESTSAMDFDTEFQVVRILTALVKQHKVGMIMVTHRIGLAGMSERISVLEDGSVTASGSHYDLLLTKNIYSNYYNLFTNRNEIVNLK